MPTRDEWALAMGEMHSAMMLVEVVRAPLQAFDGVDVHIAPAAFIAVLRQWAEACYLDGDIPRWRIDVFDGVRTMTVS